MKSFLDRAALIIVFAGLTLVAGNGQTPPPGTPLNNASVVKLARAGFKEKTIISIIDASPPNFDLSPDRMIELKRSGVSEKIILEMLARQQSMSFSEDDLSNDPFFNQGSVKPRDTSKPDNGNTADIFGSNAGGQSSTKSRGGNSSTSGEVQTTGTATVRIIRPPTEGGAAPKLEKTPPLTNDSIVDLVEAGFSEGTIIRRIEQSPVEFDLSPAKINDLRKRRVSDKILTAMKAAMGDDSKQTGTGTVSNGTSKPE
jgi:hypothetical protein